MIPGCADNAMRSPKSTAAIIAMALPAPLTIRQNACHTSLAGDCGAARRGFNPANARQQEGPQPDSRLLCFRPHQPAALQALGRPDSVEIVEFRNRLGAGRQRHPLLLGGRENVDVRRTAIRVVEGADADEPDRGTGLRVVAPNRDPAGRAAGNLLTFAARGGRRDDFRLASGVHDTIGLIEGVERMRGPGLALEPMTMAGMGDQWGSDQTISDLPA